MRKPGRLVGAVAAGILVAAACSKSADKQPQPPPPVSSSAAAAPTDQTGSGKQRHRRPDGKHEDRHDPEIANPPPLELTVAISGAASTWHQDAFDKVAKFTGNTRANDGEARDVWSLRDLARTLVGPSARVTSITGEGGSKPIDRAAWDDATHTPVLHTTRRGTLKFRWADATGAWGDSEIRDVTRVEIAK